LIKSGLFGIGAPSVSIKILSFGVTQWIYTHMWSDWHENLDLFEARFRAKLPPQSVEGNFHINLFQINLQMMM